MKNSDSQPRRTPTATSISGRRSEQGSDVVSLSRSMMARGSGSSDVRPRVTLPPSPMVHPACWWWRTSEAAPASVFPRQQGADCTFLSVFPA
nr:hypothetical protein Itr_chr06CG13230 [Ipomoea trifida]GLL29634.1 hypothetical protein Itr_chr06CG13240 [Ipomoea trifida]